MCVTGRTSGPCADATDATTERQRSIRPPTTGGAVLLDACLMLHSARERDALRRVDREVDLPRQRLVRDLVGHLDFEPVVAFGERRQRHRLTALELMAGRD